MHLRDFVTSYDVNVAIQVMLDSFISAQKFSVARSMQRKFRKYLSFEKDPHELLLYLLHNLLRETLHFLKLKASRSAPGEDVTLPEEVTIEVDDFETRAREV